VVGANPDSSDSEEVYVYESNPSNAPSSQTNPISKPVRPGMHSRTPSMTSISSAYAGNAAYGTVPAGRGRSSHDEGYSFPTVTRAQVRSLHQKSQAVNDENRRRSILTGFYLKSPILILDDSPFAMNGKVPLREAAPPRPPQTIPASRSPRPKGTFPRGPVKTPKWAQSQFYDDDDDPDSSSERVPLMPRDPNRSFRRFKGYKSRARQPSSKQQAQIQANYERRRNGRLNKASEDSQCWPGIAGTAVLVVTLLVLSMLTMGFVFQTSRSLEGVVIQNVTNVIVSHDELIMDVLVRAGNPNFLPVVIGDNINIDIFARSDHFDGKSRHSSRSLWPPWDSDPVNKKPPKNEQGSLLLGTIHLLEETLSFPSESFKPDPFTVQKGQMKLVGPAVNATDGPEKWNNCIQFDFELIVRGTMKYKAPIGGRERAVAVEWRGTIDPLGNQVWKDDSWVDENQ
jgi:Vacuolar segregation subunit 7